MKSKAQEKGFKFMRKRIVETGKPFDEAELPKMLSIVKYEAKKEVFDDIKRIKVRLDSNGRLTELGKLASIRLCEEHHLPTSEKKKELNNNRKHSTK